MIGRGVSRRWFGLASSVALLLAKTGLAAWESKVVVGDLERPSAVAVQPDTDHVFVAESARGRILRVVEGVAAEVITELPVDPQASPPRGPQGLLFLDAQTLLVASVGVADRSAALLLFRLAEPGAAPLTPRDAIRIEPASDASPPLREDFGGLLLTKNGILASTSGKDATGWILRAEAKSNEGDEGQRTFGPLQRFLDAGNAANQQGPVCMTVSPRGELAVGHAGQTGVDGDSRLTLFRVGDQRRLLSLPTGLHDLVGLCYSGANSPANSPLLYAIDQGGTRPEEAGLYRLDASFREGRQAILATRVLTLEQPTAITAGPDQGFYVTILGKDATEASQSATGKTGRLLQLAWKP